MSLVTAAISISRPSLRHSSATSAVFPEPTGPPTPSLNVLMRLLRRSRDVQPRALALVQHGARVDLGREGVHVLRLQLLALFGGVLYLPAQLVQDALRGA